MPVKRNFKDSVFTALFSNPDLLRELYCALEGVSLPPDVPVSINTLDNVLFLDFINDISFEIGGKMIVLIEHQSTINPNMALRLLFYITRLLEKRINSRKLYSKRAVTIPWPEFFVLYNGPDQYPDDTTIRLSSLFEKPEELGIPEKVQPLLELELRVININEGRNEKILKSCRKLAEYSVLMSKVRAYKDKLDNLEKGIREAIKYCSRHDILKEFLEIHGSEVLNMILEEWNTEDAIAVAREEGLEEGIERGREQGRGEGREEGLEQGREQVLDLLSQRLSIDEIEEIKSRLK